MKKRILTCCIALLISLVFCCPAFAASDIPQLDTPNYRVAFYAFDCYNMQDETGTRSGYGYDMMQGLSKYLQCTFSYVGYEKTAAECLDMLRSGELDIYTAAKLTPERIAEFAVSTHPAITATTCMNVKVGNSHVVAGDYSTYNGLRIGLLQRHTYNERFLQFAAEKGFTYQIKYYNTPTELSNALIDDEVDALVNSYIGTPEDERTIENFGQTPYYLLARKEDQFLIDELDRAIDCMNVETPNWRTELYNKYYGAQEQNTEYTAAEQELLAQLQADGATIRAVMNPDGSPYSWYEDGQAHGIAADIFAATAQALGLDYEILPVADREEYQSLLDSGAVDIWMDIDGRYEDETQTKYKLTGPYLNTTVSVLRERGAFDKIRRIAIIDDCTSIRSVLNQNWPGATVVRAVDTTEYLNLLANGSVDGALMMTYTAQKLARDDLQNRFRVDIVPGATLDLQMGVNAADSRDFYGLWEKTLAVTARQIQAETVQSYVEQTSTPTMLAVLFDHPVFLIALVVGALLFAFFVFLFLLSARNARKQKQISAKLSAALDEAQKANDAKQNFFSKMSHDIRTPLNVVLGMTQIAQKYKNDTPRLENALENITSEGSYLLVLINSILDVNQLEHGHVELLHDAFSPAETLEKCAVILRPLADKKEQLLTIQYPDAACVVVGDSGRYSQIMINIISNAIKYTPVGGHIHVTLESLPGNRLRFTCTDNGIGMTEDFITHITDDYSRAEDSRVSKVQGTGLGMSVVKGFADLMNGTLTIQSKLGEGSTFTVDIPFAAATPAQCQQVLNPPQKQEDAADSFTGKKVLLAEDNALNAEIAMELLQSVGFTVDWAENGQLAVEQFNGSDPGKYYAVFMDMQMPVMDGVEATKQIRASSRPDHNVPIFAMTANTFASDRKRCFDAGMSGYIAKPINLLEITTTLHRTIMPQAM